MEVRERAVGVVPVRRDPDGWRVLVLRAYKNWDFPKGRIDTGEEPLEAALREAREEAALTDLSFAWGQVTTDTAPYAKGKVATYYVARTHKQEVELPVSVELGRPEHHEGRWATFDEAAQLLPARLRPVLSWARGVVEGY